MAEKRRRAWHGLEQRNKRIHALIKRDGKNCCFCGQPIDFLLPDGDPMEVTIEHTVPLSDGGSNKLYNLKLAHAFCNQLEGRAHEERINRKKDRNV